MIPSIGELTLILAFILAIIQGTLPLVGVWKNKTTLMNLAVPTARAQSLLILIAFAVLMYSFYADHPREPQRARRQGCGVRRAAPLWRGIEVLILIQPQ